MTDDEAGGPVPTGRLRRLATALDRRRDLAAGRPWLLGVAFAAFVVVSVIGVATLPDLPRSPSPVLLVAAALLAAVTLGANGAEFAVAGLLSGRRVEGKSAVVTSVLSSAANVLPIPGAVLVRVRALREHDVTYRRAFTATLTVGIAWVSTSALLAAVLLATDGEHLRIGSGVGVTALAGLAAVAWLAASSEASGRALSLVALLAVEAVSVGVSALRLLLIARGIGFDVSASDAAALALGGVLASAAGLFPGGLGIREAISAAIAPLIGLNASVAIVISAVDRLVFYLVLAITTAVLVPFARRSQSPSLGVRDPDADLDLNEV